MDQIRRTTAEVLAVIDAALSSIDHGQRTRLSSAELVALMGCTRKVQDRVTSLACVVTDEVSRRQASLAATGTPITSLIGLEEGRDSSDATRQVFQAHDVAAHESVKQAALAGTVSSRHAAAISKGAALSAAVRNEQRCIEGAWLNSPRG